MYMFLYSITQYQQQQQIQRNQQKPKKMQSLPLLKIQNEKIVLNDQSIEQLRKYDGPISVVSVCGEYRTGKSYLLNMMFGVTCFQVSPTVEACTKGISMVRVPGNIGRNFGEGGQGENGSLWVLDTEGFGSVEQNGSYDAKIFLLGILLSQAIIYNTSGSLDETSIQKIALMCRQAEILTRSVENQEQEEEIDNEYLQKDMQFYWVIRDFALSLMDNNGNQISADQYLQNALGSNQQKDDSQRKAIRKMFKTRHCFPLIRPCISQPTLQSLPSIPTNQLRPQFLLQVQSLKSTILSSLPAKTIQSKQITGPEFTQLIKHYVKMINQSNFSVSLTATWEQIQGRFRDVVVGKFLERVDGKIEQYEKFMPVSQEDLGRLKKEIGYVWEEFEKGQPRFNSIKQEANQIKKTALRKFIDQNNDKIEQKCQNYLQQHYRQIISKYESEKPTSFAIIEQKFISQLQKLKKSYELRFKNYTKSITLQKYNETLQKLLTWHTKKTTQTLTNLSCTLTHTQSTVQSLQSHLTASQHQITHLLHTQQSLKNDQISLQIKYAESVDQVKNYEEIVKRMERVNQNLREEFQILKMEGMEMGKVMGEKIGECERKLGEDGEKLGVMRELVDRREKEIEELGKKLITQNEYYEKEMQSKKSKFLQILQTQRSQFQSLLHQKSTQITHLQSSLSQSSLSQQTLSTQLSQLHTEYDSILKSTQLHHENELHNLNLQLEQARAEVQLMRVENQRLCQEVERRLEEVEMKNGEIGDLGRKLRLVEVRMEERECQQVEIYNRDKLALTNIIQQHKKQIMQYQQTTTKLQQTISTLTQTLTTKQSHLTSLQSSLQATTNNHQALSKKFQQNLQTHTMASQQKYELTKKQLQLEKQQIADKLREAAGRIEHMVGKIREYEGILGGKDGELGVLREKVGVLGQLGDVVEMQAKEIQGLKKKLAKATANKQALKTRYLNQSTQTHPSTSPSRSGSKSPSPKQIQPPQRQPQTQPPANMITILQQNASLKQQLQFYKQKTEKYQSELYKKINIHTFMKKKIKQDKQQEGTGDGQGQGEGEGVGRCDCLRVYGEEFDRKEIELYREMGQLNQIIIAQSQQISILQSHLTESTQSHQSLSDQFNQSRQQSEQKQAELEVHILKLTQQLQQITKKYYAMCKEANLWKIKAEKCQLFRNQGKAMGKGKGDRGGGYHDRIDGLFC